MRWCVLCLAVVGAACGKSDKSENKGGGAKVAQVREPPDKPPEAAVDAAKAAEVAGDTGTVIGKVTLDGKPPAAEALPPEAKQVCADAPADFVKVTAAADGGLAEAVVRVVGASLGGLATPPTPTVDQKGCMYKPHVVAAMIGQEIVVTNSDPTNHNVHGYVGDESTFNDMQMSGTEPMKKMVEPDAADGLVLKCDVHPWMQAYVVVSEHPYFTQTAADGTFRLEKVPVGAQKIEAVHPHLGAVTAEVTVEKDKEVTVDFKLKAADYKP